MSFSRAGRRRIEREQWKAQSRRFDECNSTRISFDQFVLSLLEDDDPPLQQDFQVALNSGDPRTKPERLVEVFHSYGYRMLRLECPEPGMFVLTCLPEGAAGGLAQQAAAQPDGVHRSSLSQ